MSPTKPIEPPATLASLEAMSDAELERSLGLDELEDDDAFEVELLDFLEPDRPPPPPDEPRSSTLGRIVQLGPGRRSAPRRPDPPDPSESED